MISKSFACSLILSAVVLSANGQLNQTCTHTKKITPAHFFQTDRVLGKWYGIEMFAGQAVDVGPWPFRCLEVEFTRTDDPLVLNATESVRGIDNDFNVTFTDRVDIDTEFPLQSIWKVTSSFGGLESDLVWLQTDYENWAVQFGCAVEEGYRYETFSIYTRERIPDPHTLEILRTLAVGYGFPAENVQPIDQVGC